MDFKREISQGSSCLVAPQEISSSDDMSGIWEYFPL